MLTRPMMLAFAATCLLGLGLGMVGAMRLADGRPQGARPLGVAGAVAQGEAAPGYYKSRPTTPAANRWGEGYIPNHQVIDQDGNTFRFYDDLVAGKKVIINFIYTSCSEICPLTTSRMAMLQDRLGDALGRDYFIYSITIDPEHDGKDELKRYAAAFNVKPGWHFLTGDPEEIAEISYKLGERAKIFGDHRQDILLGNDTQKSWARDSVLGDLDRLMLTIQEMDPAINLAKAAGDSLSQHGKSTLDLAPGEALFGRMCASCHTIGKGVRTGPDLKNVSARRDEAWLKRFITAPDRLYAEKDPVATALDANFPAVQMPNLGLSTADAEDVLSYIAHRSEAVSSASAAPTTPTAN